MPIIPSVFQPVRANDYQQRPIKTYKRYKVDSAVTTDSGYFRHNAVYRFHTPHIEADNGTGVGSRVYPVNSQDSTNQHVVWNVIDHKYYRNYNPAFSADFIGIDIQDRFLWQSASLFTAPYGQVGEKVKLGSFSVTSSVGSIADNMRIQLGDDGKGNLRDSTINTSSFASSSRNFFYMSFNDMYRKFNDYDELGKYTGNIIYQLNHVEYKAPVNGSVKIEPGIEVTSSLHRKSSGLAMKMSNNSTGQSVQIPHNDKFDRFGRCDDWTISLWHRRSSTDSTHTILSKWGQTIEAYLDKKDGKRKERKIESTPDLGSTVALQHVTDFTRNKIRTPIHLVASASADQVVYKFIACNGIKASAVSSGNIVRPRQWEHICVRNSASKLEILVNGVTGSLGNHDSLPDFTSNSSELIIGNTTRKRSDGAGGQHISEIRMYDYAVDNTGINSLANNHYLSASCYQTNVVGNVFYKNGQAVASSPLPRYNTGSGIFGNTWEVRYRGTHTIYENECLIRVPKDQFNVTMNPSSTYRPVTDGDICDANQATLPPGELRKGLFISGTLKPYITSIGLYNQEGAMLAAAKLAQPIQKNPDVDMNFVVRWDY